MFLRNINKNDSPGSIDLVLVSMHHLASVILIVPKLSCKTMFTTGLLILDLISICFIISWIRML